MKNIINLIVDNKDSGQRIDSYINKKLKLNNLILENPSKKISAGDKITLRY